MEKFCELIKGDKPVFVIFYANWCPHCRKMLPVLNELEGLDGLIVLRYNIESNSNQRLVDYYQVQTIPLMMIYKNGEQLWRWNGEIEQDQLMQTVKRLLKK